MESLDLDRPTRTRLRTFVIVWCITCVLLGVFASLQVLALQSGTDALDEVGRGLDRTGGSLGELEELPLVGGDIAAAAKTIDASATAVTDAAGDLDDTIVHLALLVLVAIALLPTVPVLLLWWLVRRPPREP